jgi:hypothetical protein
MQRNQPSGPLPIASRPPAGATPQTIHDQALDTDDVYLQVVNVSNCNSLKRTGQSVIWRLNRHVQILAVLVPVPAFSRKPKFLKDCIQPVAGSDNHVDRLSRVPSEGVEVHRAACLFCWMYSSRSSLLVSRVASPRSGSIRGERNTKMPSAGSSGAGFLFPQGRRGAPFSNSLSTVPIRG